MYFNQVGNEDIFCLTNAAFLARKQAYDKDDSEYNMKGEVYFAFLIIKFYLILPENVLSIELCILCSPELRHIDII